MSSRRTSAHGAKAKRNKPYRGANQKTGGGLATLLNRAVHDARVEDVMSLHYCEEQRNEIAGAYWLAFEQLKMHDATEAAWATLAVTLNKAMLLCETGIGEEYIPEMRAALDGMFLAQQRGRQAGSYRLDGPSLSAVSRALETHDEQMKLVTYRDVWRVEGMFEMRQAAGNVYEMAAPH